MNVMYTCTVSLFLQTRGEIDKLYMYVSGNEKV